MSSQIPSWPRMKVGNVIIDLVDKKNALSLAADALSGSGPLAVCSVNLHYLHVHMDRPHVANWNSGRVVSDGDLRWVTLMDGTPLVRRAEALTGHSWPKLAGSDLLGEILELADSRGSRVGILGGSIETHRRLEAVLGADLPSLKLVGLWAPTPSELASSDLCNQIAARIHDSKIDVLVLALSKPMQEDWIYHYGLRSGAKLFLPFGAAIEFVAAQKKRAPGWISSVGLEWAWRFMLEPRRLGRRYLIECPPAWVRLRRYATIVGGIGETTGCDPWPNGFESGFEDN